MLINVTQKHIDEGVCAQPSKCAVSLALLDVLRPDIHVGSCAAYSMLYIGEKLYEITYDPRDPVPKFIHDYDRGLPVAPFSFEAEIPTEYLRNVD